MCQALLSTFTVSLLPLSFCDQWQHNHHYSSFITVSELGLHGFAELRVAGILQLSPEHASSSHVTPCRGLMLWAWMPTEYSQSTTLSWGHQYRHPQFMHHIHYSTAYFDFSWIHLSHLYKGNSDGAYSTACPLSWNPEGKRLACSQARSSTLGNLLLIPSSIPPPERHAPQTQTLALSLIIFIQPWNLLPHIWMTKCNS